MAKHRRSPGVRFVVVRDYPHAAALLKGALVRSTPDYGCYECREGHVWFLDDKHVIPVDKLTELEKAIYGV